MWDYCLSVRFDVGQLVANNVRMLCSSGRGPSCHDYSSLVYVEARQCKRKNSACRRRGDPRGMNRLLCVSRYSRSFTERDSWMLVVTGRLVACDFNVV